MTIYLSHASLIVVPFDGTNGDISPEHMLKPKNSMDPDLFHHITWISARVMLKVLSSSHRYGRSTFATLNHDS